MKSTFPKSIMVRGHKYHYLARHPTYDKAVKAAKQYRAPKKLFAFKVVVRKVEGGYAIYGRMVQK